MAQEDLSSLASMEEACLEVMNPIDITVDGEQITCLVSEQDLSQVYSDGRFALQLWKQAKASVEAECYLQPAGQLDLDGQLVIKQEPDDAMELVCPGEDGGSLQSSMTDQQIEVVWSMVNGDSEGLQQRGEAGDHGVSEVDEGGCLVIQSASPVNTDPFIVEDGRSTTAVILSCPDDPDGTVLVCPEQDTLDGQMSTVVVEYLQGASNVSVDKRREKQRRLELLGRPRYQCDQCPASFIKGDNFKVHMQMHAGDKPFVCEECGASFVEARYYKWHCASHKQTECGSFVCPKCSQTFVKACNLKRHMRSHQGGGLSHVCAECGAGFSKGHHLRDHMTAHRNGGVYRCALCDGVFNNAHQLKLHIKGHRAGRPYRCQECSAVFSWYSMFARHKQRHADPSLSPSARHRCATCGATFDRPSNLLRHVKTHTGEKPFKCSLCGSRFIELGHLKRHMQSHMGDRPNKCAECGAAFIERGKLLRHMQTHKHGLGALGDSAFVCENCGARFATSRQLKMHIHAHKKARRRLKLFTSFIGISSGDNTHHVEGASDNDTASGSANLCPEDLLPTGVGTGDIINVKEEVVDPAYGVTEHINGLDCLASQVENTGQDVDLKCTVGEPQALSESDLPGNCPENDPPGSNSFLEDGHDPDGDGRFKCNVCDATFVSNFYLKIHRKTHKKVNLCLKCGWRATTVEELRKHVAACRLVASSQSGLVGLASQDGADARVDASKACHLCSAVFQKYSHLKLHILMHGGDRPFECQLCGSGFKKLRDVKEHSRIHTGERPFVCKRCGAAYTQQSTLFAHARTHTRQKARHVCDSCGQSFAQHRRLLNHSCARLGRKTNICKECGKAFRHSKNLDSHIATVHKIPEPGGHTMSCLQCDAPFDKEAELGKHQRSHAQRRRYVCKACQKEFENRIQLKAHVRTHATSLPHLCRECGAAFVCAASLHMHRRRHVRDRTFLCDRCGETFRVHAYLQHHMARTHKALSQPSGVTIPQFSDPRNAVAATCESDICNPDRAGPS